MPNNMLETLEARVLFATVPVAVDPDAGDATVTVRALRKAASENGPTARPFTIARTGDTAAPLRVSYLIGGKARNGVDYQFVRSFALIAAGKSTVRVWVTPIDDAFPERREITLQGGSFTFQRPKRMDVALDRLFQGPEGRPLFGQPLTNQPFSRRPSGKLGLNAGMLGE